MAVPFRDRTEGGRVLASKLTRYADREDVQVLALPRGGVPVALEVAKALHAPLDVFLVRKLGVPGHEELAMGAIASGGVRVLNREVVDRLRISPELIEAVSAREQLELSRRERLYRNGRPAAEIRDRIAILVDDGLATGSSMRAAVAALRKLHPAKVIVAVPTASPEVCEDFQTEVDEVICAQTPEPFYSVGAWYEDFAQISDDQVREMLETLQPPQARLRLRPEAG
jgi:predicted phosphoribosyltransferase